MNDEAQEVECHAVYWNRYNEAREAGLTEDEAHAFAADHTNIGHLRLMVKQHVDPKLIARILL